MFRPYGDEKGSSTFTIDANYTDETFERGAPKGVGKHIGQWTISGLKKPVDKEGETRLGDASKATVKVKARLDGNCIVW